MWQGAGESVSGFPDEVSLSRNRKGTQVRIPLLEAPELEQNLVNNWFTKDRQLFLGSERKVKEMAKTWLKLRKSFHDSSNGDRVCFRFACAEKYV